MKEGKPGKRKAMDDPYKVCFCVSETDVLRRVELYLNLILLRWGGGGVVNLLNSQAEIVSRALFIQRSIIIH